MKKKSSNPIPQDHWEKTYPENLLKDTSKKMGAEFNPMPNTRRMTTYNKINECDT